MLPALSHARKNNYYSGFNTDALWQKLVLHDPGYDINISSKDTAIVVVSNRATASGQLRFMSEERDGDSIRFFIVYTQNGLWHVQQRHSLRTAMDALPQKDKDWVVYTEGMGKIFTTDLDRGLGLAGQYGVNVLLLDYPSIHSGYKSYRNYRFAYKNSLIAYKDFIAALDSFKYLRKQKLAGSGTLTLFFHSMGNNVLRKIAQRGPIGSYNDEVWVENLVMNAPCVPRRGSRRWMNRIHFAKRQYVHYNPEDGTLRWARIAGFRQILGEHAKKPIADEALFINFNRLCGNGHNNFMDLYGRPPAMKEAVTHYRTLFHGGAVPLSDTAMYRRSDYRGIGWDLIPANK